MRYLPLAAAVAACTISAQTNKIVSPSALTNAYGNINNSIPWGPFVPSGNTLGEIFCQQVDADLMGKVLVLKGFAFRHQYTATHAARAYTTTVTVGDAASMPAGLQTTFANNWKVGGSKTVVFAGVVNFPALGSYPFAPAPADSPVLFTTPHVYSGVEPLLWEVFTTTTTPVTPTLFFERGPGTTHISGRIGSGCTITGGSSAMSSSGSVTGVNLATSLANAPVSSPVALFFGDTSGTFAGLPLPVDLAIIGSSGCFVNANLVTSVSTSTTATGTATYSVPYTMSPSLSGQRLRTQWVAIDSANLVRTCNGLDHSVPYNATTGVAWPQNRVFVNGFGATTPVTGTVQGNGLVTEWWY